MSLIKNAYAKLENYLEDAYISLFLKTRGERNFDDIERRIAELLLDKFDKEDVVTEERIEKVIAVMGETAGNRGR